MKLDRKNPEIGDVVLIKWNGRLYPLIIVSKEEMTVHGWIFTNTKIWHTEPFFGIPFGEEEGQWRLKE